MEGIFVKLNFRKCKWLLLGTYHPPSQSDQCFFENVNEELDTYSYYEKIVLTGNLNKYMTITWKLFFIKMVSLKEKLILKVFRTQVV